MKEIPKVTIRTAMDTDDVILILQKIEDDLDDLTVASMDECTRLAKLEKVIEWIMDVRFDLEKGV